MTYQVVRNYEEGTSVLCTDGALHTLARGSRFKAKIYKTLGGAQKAAEQFIPGWVSVEEVRG